MRMSNKVKLLGFAGSLRKESFNKQLVQVALREAELAGAEVTFVDLREYPMPLYDEDIESSEMFPEKALELKEIMRKADGFFIASPEYNSSISGALKNSIDWLSRKDEEPLECFKGKVAAIMSTSPGALGGLRGLVHLRAILGNLGTIVLPDQKAIPQAFAAFNEEGELKIPKDAEAIKALSQQLVTIATKLNQTC
jgi:NAD(P)H-dependent FMN reductase